MDWLDFKIKVPSIQKEQAEFICCENSQCGIYIEDYTDVMAQALEIAHIDLVAEELLNKDVSSVVIHIYYEPNGSEEKIDSLCRQLRENNISFEVQSDTVRQEDWTENWKKYFHKIEVGENLLICPVWENPGDTERKVMMIEPGLAFGTGTHATTSLCLETLEGIIGEDTTVLDIGCGSGILSIASLILGAESAVGIDIDEKAVKTAWENAKENSFTYPKVNFLEGDLTDKVSGKYSLVVANIVADVILKLVPDVKKFLTDTGTFVVSGIIDSRVEQVRESFDLYGFKVVEHTRREEWNCFVLKCLQ